MRKHFVYLFNEFYHFETPKIFRYNLKNLLKSYAWIKGGYLYLLWNDESISDQIQEYLQNNITSLYSYKGCCCLRFDINQNVELFVPVIRSEIISFNDLLSYKIYLQDEGYVSDKDDYPLIPLKVNFFFKNGENIQVKMLLKANEFPEVFVGLGLNFDTISLIPIENGYLISDAILWNYQIFIEDFSRNVVIEDNIGLNLWPKKLLNKEKVELFYPKSEFEKLINFEWIKVPLNLKDSIFSNWVDVEIQVKSLDEVIIDGAMESITGYGDGTDVKLITRGKLIYDVKDPKFKGFKLRRKD